MQGRSFPFPAAILPTAFYLKSAPFEPQRTSVPPSNPFGHVLERQICLPCNAAQKACPDMSSTMRDVSCTTALIHFIRHLSIRQWHSRTEITIPNGIRIGAPGTASLTVGIKRITNYRPFPENDPFRLVLQASHTFKNDLPIHINSTFSVATQR